jgi:hypothetical protein
MNAEPLIITEETVNTFLVALDSFLLSALVITGIALTVAVVAFLIICILAFVFGRD